jgi:UPF0755 protein
MTQDTEKAVVIEQTTKKKRITRKTFFLVSLLSLLVLIVGIAIGFVIYVANAIQPVPKTNQQSIVLIPSGASTYEIANTLKASNLIRNERVFVYYVKWKKEGKQFKAGKYTMSSGMTFKEIIEKFNKGDVVPIDVKRITIPEGLTIKQIATQIAQQFDWSQEVILQLMEKPEQLQIPILANIPNDLKINDRLEGYLFPDTYEFKLDATEKDVLVRMLGELEKKLTTLPADWLSQLTTKGITLHQMLTIASMIEREAAVDEEREIIASVIYNRLAINMPLQIDATIQYALGKNNDRLYEQDLKVESSYNTYLNVGLPPGPIASPGLASIKAAVYPAKTEYFYYVTKKDGSNQHLFAKTYQQHLENIRLSKKN